MRFLTRPVSNALSPLVRELWLLEDDGALSAGLPKPYVELVISLEGRHWWRAERNRPERLYDTGWVTPLQTGPRYARADGRRRLIGARLEPWLATALFGRLPPGDGAPPPELSSLIGAEAEALRAELLSTGDVDQTFDRLDAWLEAHVAGRADAIRFCMEALSRRSERRRYARDVGVSPKRWQLLHRLDRVLRDPGLADGKRSLAHLAQDHGFSDQPHFSREMVRLTGVTPGRLRRRAGEGPPHLVRED